ncbi:MAG: ABC transporter permease [Eubacteriales bacterium]
MLNYLSSLPAAVAQGIIWGIMAIGVYITYKILDIADLTVDGSICTGAAVCAVMITSGKPMWLALLMAFLSGMAAGLVTGIFHTCMGIPAILAGILTQLMLWTVNLKIMKAANIPLNATKYDLLISRLDLKYTLIALAVIIVVLIGALYWFFGTEFGSSVRATGSNQNMSRAQGINTNLTKVVGLVLSNGIVAFSGALLAQYQGNSDINMGKGAIVIGLAAVIIGEALFSWLARNNFALKLLSVIFGGIIYYIVYTTVIYLGLDTDYLKMLSALLVAIFLAVPYWKKKYLSKSVAKKVPSKQGEPQDQNKTGEGKKNA